MMKTPDRIALVDMDDTLADYEAAMASAYNKMIAPGEMTYEEASRTYSRDDWPDYLWNRMDAIKRRPGWWRELPPIEAGFEIVEVLRSMDFDLHIATAGPSSKSQAWAEKLDWAREHIPDASVHVTEDKSLLYGKVLVDDWPPYAMEWLKHRPRGLVVMPAHHYNKECANVDQIFRYESGMQIPLAKCIEQLA